MEEKEETYDEITVTNEEIKKLKEDTSEVVPEKKRIAFHNKTAKYIQTTIRKSAKNKEAEVFITTSSLFDSANHPAHWQKEIVKDIVSKLKAKKVAAVYRDHCDCVKVTL